MRRIRCWLRHVVMRLRGVHWDGHCWDVSTGHCVDCGTRWRES